MYILAVDEVAKHAHSLSTNERPRRVVEGVDGMMSRVNDIRFVQKKSEVRKRRLLESEGGKRNG